ncbi:L,D-transpeptidase family protein [Coraliomargarita akajimensis]|uniref:ErfK/YbiS/YcfS/YnhG family protein n=1 Tax=Coraliomargarita akajimensis (strain DSM 45221 / IAM 15411 / JCM 23193 / KCTC 12865 / 04OKA010-24) TaxID=583355 RepID=D5EIX7_CORAD|nr:L,D-transpeptidase family protein [Coraliomargarita akajimensis]ADE54376.1 ErfK/YbiS/YcfS/YnhG family protein [Coraliomargarita akajimensis DSM 45221]
MRQRFCILLIGTILLVLLYLCGRSIWYPVYIKLRGGRTVSEVVHEIKSTQSFNDDFSQWKSLHLLCFKEERKIEVWVSGQSGTKEIRQFDFTGYSGELGPKLRQGDGQIPEGIYEIEYLNPNSSYHLSMKISYPNEFDRLKGREDRREKLGYDIFIHGKSATVGCIPIGDDGIEELFLMVSEFGKDRVQVIISPYDMRQGRRALEITEISWENELYDIIEAASMKYAPKDSTEPH